jgi:hypothetical protein
MSDQKFPKLRSDGMFTVAARFTVADDSVIALVREYVNAWVNANRVWTRIWRSNSIEQEQLAFDSEFSSPPRVESKSSGTSVLVIFEGRPSAKRWKDWVVFLADDISRIFPELKFDGFESGPT